MSASELLKIGASELGFELSELQTEQFMMYLNELKLWNEKINLTALKDDREIVIKHFLDSLTPGSFLAGSEKLLDIGTGGGFPGVPLKVLLPGLHVILFDSSAKKISFLKHLIRKLNLTGIEAVHGRAEEVDNGLTREGFDCVITRAVGSVEHVLDLSLPFVKKDGKIVLMRGRSVDDDLGLIARARGLSLVENKVLTLPSGGQERTLLLFKSKDS